MVTPVLEKLILSGKASYKTFVAGGAAKNVLPVGTNRYIIITDFTYFPFLPYEKLYDTENWLINLPSGTNCILTQMNIFSEKSFNHYVFKNEYHYADVPSIESGGFMSMGAPTKIDCYLVHEKQITFSFIKEPDKETALAGGLNTVDFGNSPVNVPSKYVPLDYGADGQPVAPINVNLRENWQAAGVDIAQIRPLGIESIGATIQPNFNDLQLPVDATTAITNDLNGMAQSYPVVNVGYVEIIGKRGEQLQTSS